MITVLRIKKRNEMNLAERILGLIRPYKIVEGVVQTDDAQVCTLTYYQRRGNIRYDKLYEKCRGKSKVILCDRKLNLFNTPFKRFNSLALNRALMQSFILNILEKLGDLPSEIHIAYYDPDAEFPSFANKLLCYTTDLTVVTDMPKFYENEAERSAAETGATFRVSNNTDDLYPCDILISPAVIRKPVPAAASTLIFTVRQPTVTVTGNVICSYNIPFPDKYLSLVPDGTDKAYFMSALYIICRRTELADILPESCGNNIETYKPESIIRQIKAKCSFSVQ